MMIIIAGILIGLAVVFFGFVLYEHICYHIDKKSFEIKETNETIDVIYESDDYKREPVTRKIYLIRWKSLPKERWYKFIWNGNYFNSYFLTNENNLIEADYLYDSFYGYGRFIREKINEYFSKRKKSEITEKIKEGLYFHSN